MHNRSRIVFDIVRVRRVVVNAVGVERHRRVSEQKNRIRFDVDAPLGLGRRWPCGRRQFAGWGILAIDQRLCLAQRWPVVGLVPVLDNHEDEASGSTDLFFDAGNAGGLDDMVADPDRRHEPDIASRPHPARLRDRRQEAAAPRMTVASDLRLGDARSEHQPMSQWRNFIARPRDGCLVEESGKPTHRPCVAPLFLDLFSPNPVVEPIHAAPPPIDRRQTPNAPSASSCCYCSYYQF